MTFRINQPTRAFLKIFGSPASKMRDAFRCRLIVISLGLFYCLFSIGQADELTVSLGEQIGEGFRPSKLSEVSNECYLDGDQAIVTHAPEGSTVTTAHVYQKGANGWEHEASLSDLVVLGDGVVFERAQAVRIDGDLALVAAEEIYGESNGVSRIVHAYQRIAGEWTYIEGLRRQSGDFGHFGFAIDLQGGTAIVTNFAQQIFSDSEGGVYSYAWEGGSWQLTEIIRGFAQNFAIGSGVDLDGDQMAIGNFERNFLGAPQNSRLHYYVRSPNGNWQLEQRIFGAEGGDRYFGQQAKLSGDWLAIRTVGGIELHEKDSGEWVLRQEIPYSPFSDNNFSLRPIDGAFDLNGDDFFVEVPNGEEDGTNGGSDSQNPFLEFVEYPDGAVHYYRRDGNSWELVDFISPVEGGLGKGRLEEEGQGRFAGAISFSNERCLVGDRVYEKNVAGRWAQTDTLGVVDALDSPTVYEQFGHSVDILGNVAVVGAPREEGNGVAFSGVVHTFIKGPNGWTRGVEITAPNAAVGDRFGNSVKLCGDSLVVGAPRTDRMGIVHHGSAYLFSRSGDGWIFESELIPSATGTGEQFGTSVGLSDSHVALGGCFADPEGRIAAGAVAVFDRGSNIGNPTMIVASGGKAGDQFGRSVDIQDDQLFVGAPFHGLETPNPAGAVFVFERSQGGWSQSEVLGGETSGERFGWSLAADPPHLVVGSPAVDADWAYGQGTFFEQRPEGWVSVLTTGYAGSYVFNRRPPLFGKSVDISGDRAVFSSEAAWRFSFGLATPVQSGAIVYDLVDGTWTRTGTYGDVGLTTVAVDGASLVAGYPIGNTDSPTSVKTVGVSTIFDIDDPSLPVSQSFSAVEPTVVAGREVAVWGNTAMVSAEFNGDGLGPDPGQILVYSRDSGSWQQTATLSLPVETFSSSGWFPRIALYGDTAALGNSRETHIYVRDGSSWQIQQTINANIVDIHRSRMVTSSGHIYRRNDRLAWEHVATLPVSGTSTKLP